MDRSLRRTFGTPAAWHASPSCRNYTGCPLPFGHQAVATPTLPPSFLAAAARSRPTGSLPACLALPTAFTTTCPCDCLCLLPACPACTACGQGHSFGFAFCWTPHNLYPAFPTTCLFSTCRFSPACSFPAATVSYLHLHHYYLAVLIQDPTHLLFLVLVPYSLLADRQGHCGPLPIC